MPLAPYVDVYRSALIPIVAEADGSTTIGTGLFVRHRGRNLVIGAEHANTSADRYGLAPVQTTESSVRIDPAQERWTTGHVVRFHPERHPILLEPSGDAEAVFENRSPLSLDWLTGHSCSPAFGRSEDSRGEDYETSPSKETNGADSRKVHVADETYAMGFWARRPNFPAQLRRGIISVLHDEDIFLDMKIVHGISGGPVWRREDGRFLGCAQVNLYDDLVLDQALPSPGGAIDTISNHANLILVQSPAPLFSR